MPSLRALIDHAFDRQLDGTADYAPPDDLFHRFEHLVMAVLSGQGLLAVYSPSAVEHVLNLFEEKGLLRVLRDYFGTEPAVSSKKWTLRRGSGLTFPGWHPPTPPTYTTHPPLQRTPYWPGLLY